MSGQVPPATPPSSAAPYAAPSSTTGRSSGSSSTEAMIRSHSSERAPPPETRPRSRLDAELAQQVERVAQPVRDALEHRAGERAAVVAQREAGERAARVRVGVRRALAGEVRQERQPLGAGLPRGRACDELAEAGAGRGDVAQPRSEPAAESITPIACQPPGTAWQNAWTRARGSAANAGSAANTTPLVPSAIESGPGTVDADAERAGRLVARAGGDRHAVGVRPETSGDSSRRGSQAGSSSSASSTSSLQRRPRDVEQQRARRVGHVGRVLAAQPQPHVVLGQHDPRDPRVVLGLVLAQPQQLRGGEAGQRAVAGQRDQPLEADLASISAHSAAVRPSFHRIAGRMTRSAASSATSPCI